MIGGDGVGYFIQAETGVNLYVEDINPQSGKAIVFLHGWPLSYLQFEYQ
ncbi:alpha/beta hydrolase, partial [Bacillus haynesii]|nr:alpha/beta hydrolase [Bacillus haynesii]